MKKILTIIILLLSITATAKVNTIDAYLQEGVSHQLAEHRKHTISDLYYNLSFALSEDVKADIPAKEIITLTTKKKEDIIIDFREDSKKIHSITVNGKSCDYIFYNEHIIIPATSTKKGKNTINIDFTAGNQPLNRRKGYMYTLFVPDRARTAFPCFDQPNLKARFTLSLTLPKTWTAVSNGKVIDNPKAGKSKNASNASTNRTTISFAETEPLPTYLFAFAAGEFQRKEYSESGYTVSAYYRETDPKRLKQLPDIMHQVVFSLNWLERYTGVKYPFQKYDLVILPGFQFGGMEHTGATFYNDNTLFLPENPTQDELLNRTQLISHETSHMWFGDAVTMDWFNDVWTKEVFANYFAAEITAPLFPNVNHNLNWLKTYVASAISQDRTEGRTSIRQSLDNMRYAGLIYNNIIYNKAPIMMRKMVEMMGKEAFQRGIQKYVHKYIYGNATWDDLVHILDAETHENLKKFSEKWVDRAEFPQFKARTYLGDKEGKKYGYVELDSKQIADLMQYWPTEKDATSRQALLMRLEENYLHKHISNEDWLNFLIYQLAEEQDNLTASTICQYINEPLMLTKNKIDKETYEKELMIMMKSHRLESVRVNLFRLLSSAMTSKIIISKMYDIWKSQSMILSENDYTTLAYELSIRQPYQAKDILAAQRQRITNADRLAQFDYISQALSPSQQARDKFFNSLSNPENRRIEPWALTSLYYLNHPLRQNEAVKYIRPALNLLPEIQRTGDIFFPANWCSRLLAGHRSKAAYAEVQKYLKDNPTLLPLLKNKVLQAEFYLKRSAN